MLKGSLESDYAEGRETAVDMIRQARISLVDIERIIEDREVVYELRDQFDDIQFSEAFLAGFQDAAQALLEEAKKQQE